jgi:hypothetical protein
LSTFQNYSGRDTNLQCIMPRSDKGLARPHYNNTFREDKSLMRQVDRNMSRTLRQLIDAQVVDSVIPRQKSGRPRRERRAEHRESLLPKDRICPFCNEVKLKSRQWVIENHAGVIVAGCKGCWMRNGERFPKEAPIPIQ